MFIEWKFNDEAKGISLEEFERDNEDFFGYMMIKLGDYQLGWAEKSCPIDEGDDDISYYINSLIKCGIAMLIYQDYKVHLLGSNLLEIRTHRCEHDNINITVFRIDTKKIVYSYEITYRELIDEINENYKKYINGIQEMNRELLESKTVKNTIKYYDDFTRLLG